jgi:hypothetical protein
MNYLNFCALKLKDLLKTKEFLEFARTEHAIWKGPKLPFYEWLAKFENVIVMRFDEHKRWEIKKFHLGIGDTTCTDNRDIREKLPLCLF